jgi:dihydropyrimidinase
VSTAFDLVVRDATVATAADTMRCDIGIRGGRIAALGEDLAKGADEIAAKGALVTPGGVDGHCHFEQELPDGAQLADDFLSGTRSAACGGTTTIIPFACQFKGQSMRAAVAEYHRRAEGKPLIDYAFHLIVSDPNPQVLGQEMPALIRDGYTSFKIYMTYDILKLTDREILDVLALARRERAMTMIHAENSDVITWLTEKLELAGRTAPKFHATSRPVPVEREATHRAITFSELLDVPILIVHVSSRDATEQIRWAQSRGLRIYAETCPQYLLLTESDLDKPGGEGAKCVCSPPPRTPADQAAIWEGLVNGTFTIVSSDHSPFSYGGPNGKFLHGPNPPFTKIPNGVPGVETRLPLLYSEGVGKGRISLQQFVALTATNPARLYGLYPRKGTIAIGSDADLVIWSEDSPVTVTNAMLHHACDYTPYEGMQLAAWPAVTLCRGRAVYRDGALCGEAGHGAFQACERPLAARVPPPSRIPALLP